MFLVKPVFNNHLRDPKFAAEVDRWSLIIYSVILFKMEYQNGSCCKLGFDWIFKNQSWTNKLVCCQNVNKNLFEDFLSFGQKKSETPTHLDHQHRIIFLNEKLSRLCYSCFFVICYVIHHIFHYFFHLFTVFLFHQFYNVLNTSFYQKIWYNTF
jgi:hypothetical protein